MYYQTSKTLWQDSFLCNPHTGTAAVISTDTVMITMQCKLAMLQVMAVMVAKLLQHELAMLSSMPILLTTL